MLEEFKVSFSGESSPGNYSLVAETGVIGVTFTDSEEAHKAESLKDEVK